MSRCAFSQPRLVLHQDQVLGWYFGPHLESTPLVLELQIEFSRMGLLPQLCARSTKPYLSWVA